MLIHLIDLDADGDTKGLDSIIELCAGHTVTVVAVDQAALNGIAVSPDAEAVIVAGAYRPAETADLPLFGRDAGLAAAAADTPLLGVGLGFELVLRAFGADLSAEADLALAADTLIPTDEGAKKVFQGADPIRVAATKRWNLEDLPKGFIKLAVADDSVEAFRHKTLPLYGIQLYPGDFVYASDGKLVFQNLLTLLTKR